MTSLTQRHYSILAIAQYLHPCRQYLKKDKAIKGWVRPQKKENEVCRIIIDKSFKVEPFIVMCVRVYMK